MDLLDIIRKNPKIVRWAMISLAVVLALLIVNSLGHLYAARNNGTLNLTVDPSPSTVQVDKQNTVPGKISLTPGPHEVIVSYANFKSQTIAVTITKGQTTTQSVVLSPANSDGVAYLQANPNEEAGLDGQESQVVAQKGATITQDNPLIQLLPYVGSNFQIDAGISQKTPNQDGAAAIYITANTDAAKNNALKWIRAQGYDPAGYEIIYQTYGGVSPTALNNPSGVPTDGE